MNYSIETMKEEELQALYMEWFNNFITVELFAEYLECSVDTAHQIVYYGREAHNRLSKRSTTK
tara:strand:+ start:136 stop:324 length:189 start_codon:yes stop_codon:yes gene_type:complete